MLEEAQKVIDKIRELTDEVILFHSASGKDSIVLCDMLSKSFRKVVCVYMYIVKGMESQEMYMRYAKTKYPNVTFMQVPHYAWYSYAKYGYMGCVPRPQMKKYTLAELTDIARGKTGIEWAFFGFKQSDSLNRRVMLRTYEDEAINYKTKKVYPLSKYKNRDCMEYIKKMSLIHPETTENCNKTQSSGVAISDLDYLLFLRSRFPQDLKLIINEYPLVERLLYEYDFNQMQPTK